VDSEVMLGVLARAGYRFTARRQEADILILNTCAFIEDATREALALTAELARQKQQGRCKYLVVCGCLPQRYRETLLEQLPGVDLFLGTGEFQHIARHLRRLAAGSTRARMYCGRPTFLMRETTPRILATGPASAYIKIAEGCSHGCTYCTIPSIRGPYQGRSARSIIREARSLAARGVREINLVAQDTTRYAGLPALLEKLAAIPELRWIRLLYGHPQHLHSDVLRVMAGEEKICSYLDLPLQHIADPVLKRMGRRSTGEKIKALLAAARKLVPDIALRTTFIVGFPGETARDFKALLAFVREFRFDHLGAFAYRDEQGTPAARMTPKVPESVKQERFHELMRLQAQIARKKNRQYAGQELEVLVEGRAARPGFRIQGRTAFQAPEVDGVVLMQEDVPAGTFVRAKITRALTYDLAGTVLPCGR
jgi:ribosomal protein S12 methylthiotransferase